MAQMFRILGKRGRITIPFEIRQRVGFSYNDILSFTEAPDGRTVIVKREKSATTVRQKSRRGRMPKTRLRSLTSSTVSPTSSRRLPSPISS